MLEAIVPMGSMTSSKCPHPADLHEQAVAAYHWRTREDDGALLGRSPRLSCPWAQLRVQIAKLYNFGMPRTGRGSAVASSA